jgi:hypothetical protein
VGEERLLASTATRAAAYVEEVLHWLPDEPVPASLLPPSPEADDQSTSSKMTAAAGGPPPRILWADDNADLRAYVAGLLAP